MVILKLKILSLALCVLMMFSVFSAVNISAQATVMRISAPDSASAGEKITVTLKTASSYDNVGGIRMCLEYDDTLLRYTEGSRELLDSDILDKDLTPDKANKNKLYFVWEVEKGVTLEEKIVSYQFEVLADAVDCEAKIYLSLYEMYKADKDYTPIITQAEIDTHTVNIGIADEKVKAVKDKIAAIGEVEYTTECKALIDAAFSAYNALSTVQKQQVSNYDILVNALYRYNELKDEAKNGDIASQVNAYRNEHKNVLKLTVKTVSLADENGVKAAIDAWNAIASPDVKGELIAEKNLLKTLTTRIEELKKIAEDEAAEAVLRAEAKELARQFREYYAGVLAFTVDTITVEDRMGVTTALSELANFEFVNTYVIDELKTEKELLESLKAKIDQLEAESGAHPERAEAEEFSEKFGWILSLETSDVTADDYVNISIAYSYFEDLSDEAKALLPGAEEKLQDLLAASEELFYAESEPEVEIKTETVEKEVIKTETVEKEVVKTETVEKEVVKTEKVEVPVTEKITETVTETIEVPVTETVTETITETVTETVEANKYITRQLHPMVLWAVIIFAVSISALAASVVAFFTRKKKETTEREEAL